MRAPLESPHRTLPLSSRHFNRRCAAGISASLTFPFHSSSQLVSSRPRIQKPRTHRATSSTNRSTAAPPGLHIIILHGRTAAPSTTPPPRPHHRRVAEPPGLAAAALAFQESKFSEDKFLIDPPAFSRAATADSLGFSSMSAAAAGQEVVAPAIVAEAEEWEVCGCCGLREECTPAYAAGVRARYGGRWLCGLCGDAVGEEVAAGGGSVLEVEAAIAGHAAFCRALSDPRTPAAAERLIAAVRRLLRNADADGKEDKAVVVVEFQEQEAA